VVGGVYKKVDIPVWIKWNRSYQSQVCQYRGSCIARWLYSAICTVNVSRAWRHIVSALGSPSFTTAHTRQ
jgi:hypothetical protein